MRLRGLPQLFLVAALAGCGAGQAPTDAAPIPSPDASDASDAQLRLGQFVISFGQAFCRRIYSCCEAADVQTVSPGTDERTCAAEMAAFAQSNAEFLLSYHGIVFDPAHASHCLDVLNEAACAEIFEPRFGTLTACQDVFPGSLPAGDGCDDGHECLSSRCSSGACTAEGPPTCAATQYLDDSIDICLRRHALGASCSAIDQCEAGDTCVNDLCVEPLEDGAPCTLRHECVGTCRPGPDGRSFCRTGYCRGS
jgi:hypothetical protein